MAMMLKSMCGPLANLDTLQLTDVIQGPVGYLYIGYQILQRVQGDIPQGLLSPDRYQMLESLTNSLPPHAYSIVS